ncbi:hypothetical protein BDR26DRAFT_917119 [Obelidium mucronatum]|nr:hypothetical protein BDR26DRAFT_917119 [Obelidium mucronatum]
MRRSRGLLLLLLVSVLVLLVLVVSRRSGDVNDKVEGAVEDKVKVNVNVAADVKVDARRPLALLLAARGRETEVAETDADAAAARALLAAAVAEVVLPLTKAMDHRGDYVLRARADSLDMCGEHARPIDWAAVSDLEDAAVRNETITYSSKLNYFQNYISRLPKYNPNKLFEPHLRDAEKINGGWRLWWGNQEDMRNWTPRVIAESKTKVLPPFDSVPPTSSAKDAITTPKHIIRVPKPGTTLSPITPSQNSSQISCSFLDHDIPLRYCKAENIAFQLPDDIPSFLNLLNENQIPEFGTLKATCSNLDEENWFKGRIMGNGAARWFFDALQIDTPTTSNDSAQINCDAWVDTPLFMISRWDTGNPYQAHQDFFNAFSVYAALNLSVDSIQPIFLDPKTPNGPFFNAWTHVFSTSQRFITLSDLISAVTESTQSNNNNKSNNNGNKKSKTICIKESVWNVHGGVSPLARYGAAEWMKAPRPLNQRQNAAQAARLSSTSPSTSSSLSLSVLPKAPLFLAFRAFMLSGFRRSVLGILDETYERVLDPLEGRGLPVPRHVAFPEEDSGGGGGAGAAPTGEHGFDGQQQSWRSRRQRPITVTYAVRKGGNRAVNERGVLWESTKFGWPLPGGVVEVDEEGKEVGHSSSGSGSDSTDSSGGSNNPTTTPTQLGGERDTVESFSAAPLQQPPTASKKVSRTLRNEQELIHRLQKKVENWMPKAEREQQAKKRWNWWNLFFFQDPHHHPSSQLKASSSSSETVPYARFRAVDFSTLTFEEQVAVSQGTDFFIGPHGAVFAQLIYLRRRPVAAVLELKPRERSVGNSQFGNLAKKLEHMYDFVNLLVSDHVPANVLVQIEKKVEAMLDNLI